MYPLAAVTPVNPRLLGDLVLVVDDDPINLLVASERLSFIGIKPLLGDDGAEAVALACELDLHLILMHLQMPVLRPVRGHRPNQALRA